MFVVHKNSLNAEISHHVHRYAVGQAVALVVSRFVKGQASLKMFEVVRNHLYVGIVK